MTTFTQFSEMIERLLGGARCVRITVDGYMPLVAEEIGASSIGTSGWILGESEK